MIVAMLGNSKSRQPFVAPKLQITAMMDMFTIIVFFLLFSYAEKPDDVELSKDIELPASSTERDYEDTIKVFLSPNTLEIEGEVVAVIESDKIVGYDPKNPKASKIYIALEKIRLSRLDKNPIEQVSEEGDIESSEEPKKPKTPEVLFFCDKSVPFKAINTVMKTIGMAGYPNMQFAVIGGR